jgi:hypothetical protein
VCLRLLEQVSRIEDAVTKGIARNPHTGDTKHVALVMIPSRPLASSSTATATRIVWRVRVQCALGGALR